jgi:hypothetical protein
VYLLGTKSNYLNASSAQEQQNVILTQYKDFNTRYFKIYTLFNNNNNQPTNQQYVKCHISYFYVSSTISPYFPQQFTNETTTTISITPPATNMVQYSRLFIVPRPLLNLYFPLLHGLLLLYQYHHNLIKIH